MERCDALVIGGGAAGSVAALKLARAGLRTVLVERSARIGGSTTPKIDITQDTGIHPFAKELGIPLEWHSRKSRWLSRNSSFSLKSRIIDLFIRRGPGKGSLESSLLKKAAGAGCEIRTSTNVRALNPSLSSKGGVAGLESGRKRELVSARYIISADGSASRFAHSCIAPPGAQDRAVFQGFGVLAEGMRIEPETTHVFFDPKLAPGGYFYICADKNGKGVAAIATEPRQSGGKPADWHFKRFVENNTVANGALKGMRRAKCFMGSCSAGKCRSHHYKNMLFTGDAGRLLDPLLGYGLNHAIRSGYYAAEAIISNMGERTSDVSHAYEERLAKEILPELRNGERARRVFNAFSNSDFDTLVELVHEVSKDANLDDFFDDPLGHPSEIARAVLAKPGTFLLLRHLRRVL